MNGSSNTYLLLFLQTAPTFKVGLWSYTSNGTCQVGYSLIGWQDSTLPTLLLFCAGNGVIPSPFDCYLVNQGLSTLHVRMRQHQKNAFAVANFLETFPLVEKVMYPGIGIQGFLTICYIVNRYSPHHFIINSPIVIRQADYKPIMIYSNFREVYTIQIHMYVYIFHSA